VGKGLTEREERGRRKVRWGEAREKGASRRGAGQSQWKDQTSDSRWFQRQHGLLRGWKEGELRAGPGKGAHPDGEGMTHATTRQALESLDIHRQWGKGWCLPGLRRVRGDVGCVRKAPGKECQNGALWLLNGSPPRDRLGDSDGRQ